MERSGLLITARGHMARRTKAPNGEPERFFREVVLTCTSEECLVWPYSKAHGYGYAALGSGKPELVHRKACEAIHGPAPEATSLSLHSCGNGHLGCVNPKHLYWGSRPENARDALAHGVIKSPITESIVQEIRRLSQSKSINALADIYGVNPSVVSKIIKRESWSWVA